GRAEVEVAGLAGAPSLHRGSRGALHFVANGRTIVSRSLTHAVEQAYAGLIPAGRHPVALVRITVPSDQIDVNVHPTKAEVRFRHERLVYATVAAAVRDVLGGAVTPVAPDLAPGLAFAPSLPSLARPSLEAPVFDWPAPAADLEEGEPPALGAAGRAVIAGAQATSFLPSQAEPREGGEAGEASAPGTMAAAMPALRPLGQVDLTYIVAEAPDGMYVEDQHAAHERVKYELVLARRASGLAASQPLLDAAVVTLSTAQVALVEESVEALAAIGWAIEPADGTAVIMRAVPAGVPVRDPARALLAYLDRLAAEERLTGPDRVAATLACRAAVMAGDRLELEQQRALLRALEACATPHTCPHGRPTMLHLSSAALERSFGRR
ncbi:MAG: DNA mismatch repair protein MutL, partial [Dehalococcoidia bacterium]|nr:DNA mismatch repair protein MutL [Dehalococcoidia bacterium]